MFDIFVEKNPIHVVINDESINCSSTTDFTYIFLDSLIYNTASYFISS